MNWAAALVVVGPAAFLVGGGVLLETILKWREKRREVCKYDHD